MPSHQRAYRIRNHRGINPQSAWTELERGALLREVAGKYGMDRRTLSDRLLKEDPGRYRQIMRARSGVSKKVDLAPVWAQLERGLSVNSVANEHRISRPALTRRLRKDNLDKYKAIMRDRIQERNERINLEAVWIEIRNGRSIRRIAGEMLTTPATLYYRLRRAYAGDYRKVTDANRRRPRTQIPIDIWNRLESGESMTKLCAAYGIDAKTLRKRLRQSNRQRYGGIRSKYGSRPKPIPPLATIWNRFKQGETIKNLARQYNVSCQFLSHRLQAIHGHKYKELITRNRSKRKINNAKQRTPNQIWNRLRKGETIQEIAYELGISGNTLSYRLQQINKSRYERLMDRRKVEFPPISDLWDKLRQGQSLTELGKECDIPRKTLTRKLQKDNPKKYRKIMKTINLKHRLSRQQLFSLRRQRIQGAESLFELQVRRVLESHNIQFEYRPYVRLGKHVYFPDFRLPYNTIIEAAAVSFKTYWQHYSNKTRSYIKHGYNAVIVVPASLIRKAEKYLPRHRTSIIKITDLNERIEQILTQINVAYTPASQQPPDTSKDDV